MTNLENIVDCEFDNFVQHIEQHQVDIEKISIYTDGACSGNPGPGGWGAVLIFNKIKTTLSGFEQQTTNNRMELMAAIAAINALSCIPKNKTCILYTDSSYVKNGITSWILKWQKNNWKSSSGKAIKNQDLWMQLNSACSLRKIEWIWVKGHADCIYNNAADLLARNAIISSYMSS